MLKWPSDAKVAFAIRDDDISYFTQPWMLEAVYGEAWKLGFKVSLAAIPNVRATKLRLVPPYLRRKEKNFLISENRELVDYLREQMAENRIDIVQHGFSHQRKGKKPEFAERDYAIVNDKILKGRKILIDALGQKITVFAAPHERISRATLRSLCNNEINLCRKFTAGRFLLTAPVSRRDISGMAKLVLLNPIPFRSIKDNIISLNRIVVVQWDIFLMGKGIDSQLAESQTLLAERLAIGGTFVLAQHYWEYFDTWKPESIRKERVQKFHEFLRFASSKGKMWKAGLSDIAFWAKKETVK